jgi:hypothetical protein
MNLYLKQVTLISYCFLILFCNACKTAPCDAPCLADKVCDCVAKANGNMVKLTKCYNKSQILKKKHLVAEDESDFDTAIRRCFGVAVLEEIIKKSFKKS